VTNINSSVLNHNTSFFPSSLLTYKNSTTPQRIPPPIRYLTIITHQVYNIQMAEASSTITLQSNDNVSIVVGKFPHHQPVANLVSKKLTHLQTAKSLSDRCSSRTCSRILEEVILNPQSQFLM
jgi:hypothetical protein